MPSPLVAMVGGTGFIGRAIAAELTEAGYRIRVLTRSRERTKRIIVLPEIDLVETDVHDPESLAAGLAGADAVIFLSGILNEARAGDFARVHTDLPGAVAKACAKNGIGRLLHMSALKASADGPSQYLRSKAAGEAAVLAAAGDKVAVTVFRPSVVFGPEDDFFNRFATLLGLVPGLFPLACANARFAPVYVGDVARAFVGSINDKATFGEAYNLCGPAQYSLLDLVRYTADQCGYDRYVMALGDGLSQAQARLMGKLPGSPFTMDNYHSMQTPSTCDGDDLSRLGITPTHVDSVVPGYLGERRKQGRLARFRAAAGRG